MLRRLFASRRFKILQQAMKLPIRVIATCLGSTPLPAPIVSSTDLPILANRATPARRRWR